MQHRLAGYRRFKYFLAGRLWHEHPDIFGGDDRRAGKPNVRTARRRGNRAFQCLIDFVKAWRPFGGVQVLFCRTFSTDIIIEITELNISWDIGRFDIRSPDFELDRLQLLTFKKLWRLPHFGTDPHHFPLGPKTSHAVLHLSTAFLSDKHAHTAQAVPAKRAAMYARPATWFTPPCSLFPSSLTTCLSFWPLPASTSAPPPDVAGVILSAMVRRVGGGGGGGR